MFRDIATTREGWHVASVSMMAVMTVFWWWAGLPLWAVTLAGIASIAGIVRCVIPASYELIVDPVGLRWGRVGKEKKKKFDWAQVRQVRYVQIERELYLDTGSAFLMTVPEYFLRSDQKKEDFLNAVRQFSPGTPIQKA